MLRGSNGLYALLYIMLFFPFMACADSVYSDDFNLCIDNAKGGNTWQCYENERIAQDKKLGILYHKLFQFLDEDIKNAETNEQKFPEILAGLNYEKKYLRLSEREWIKFRDINCEYLKNEPTGIPSFTKTQCLLSMTMQRYDDLERMLPH